MGKEHENSIILTFRRDVSPSVVLPGLVVADDLESLFIERRAVFLTGQPEAPIEPAIILAKGTGENSSQAGPRPPNPDRTEQDWGNATISLDYRDDQQEGTRQEPPASLCRVVVSR